MLNVAGILTHPVFSIAAGIKFINKIAVIITKILNTLLLNLIFPKYMFGMILYISFQCPVYDLARNVEFTGYFQTMTTKAAITTEVEFNF